jgi:RNA polymerase sigma-70 factor (ECF subfamily)
MRETNDLQSATETTAAGVDLEDVERRARLFRAVDKLPDDQRRVIVLRFAEEKSIREIADELGRSEGAIKQLQFRGLENLRSRLSI